jgi:hypothetical protein
MAVVLSLIRVVNRDYTRTPTNRGTFVHYYVCDTEAELPVRDLFAGDQAYTKDSGKNWSFDTTSTWTEVGGGAAHPDLATHDVLGLATDAELAIHEGAAEDEHD